MTSSAHPQLIASACRQLVKAIMADAARVNLDDCDPEDLDVIEEDWTGMAIGHVVALIAKLENVP